MRFREIVTLSIIMVGGLVRFEVAGEQAQTDRPVLKDGERKEGDRRRR